MSLVDEVAWGADRPQTSQLQSDRARHRVFRALILAYNAALAAFAIRTIKPQQAQADAVVGLGGIASAERTGAQGLWRAVLPYAVVPVVGILLWSVTKWPTGPVVEAGVYLGAGLLSAMVLLRQVVAIVENRRLYHQLHTTVARLDEAYQLAEINNRALADANIQLQALATTDPLTGIANHRAMAHAIDQEIERSYRFGRPCAVLFIDLDHFKSLNDTYGHSAGDAALRDVASIMQANVRAVDVAGRWGGEEFVLLLPETDMQVARLTAERIRIAVANHVFPAAGDSRWTCSIGVAVYPDHGSNCDELIDMADNAMYRAKRLGRNRVRSAGDGVATVLTAVPSEAGKLSASWRSLLAHQRHVVPVETAAAPGDLSLRRSLATSAERLHTLYAAIAGSVVILNAAGEIIYANMAAQELLGARLEDIYGRVLADSWWHPMRLDGSPFPMAERPAVIALRTGQPQRNVMMRLVRPDGVVRALQVDAVPLLGDDGMPAQVVVSYIDLTARLQAEESLRHQALHDALTGLPNRTLLLDRLAQGIGTSPLALLLIDLARFKEINDTFGHHCGDLLLQQVARRVEGIRRAADTVAYLGGDEFAMLLPATEETSALRIAHALIAALESPFEVEGHTFQVGASLGLALCPAHGTDAQTLLRHAGVAVYAARQAGNDFGLYDATQDQYSVERLALVTDLRQAIAQDDLVLHYQPKVDVETGRVCGVEALVRWPHAQRGLIPPDQFIPLAERTSLIKPLTAWVLEAALRQSQAWRMAGLELEVAVNLSMWNLRDPDLPTILAGLLEAYAMPPAQLRLEITETTIMEDATLTLDVLGRLGALGVRLSIDDFGTGYSSLAYLKRLKVDELKIDKSFLQDVATDEAGAIIVRSTIGLGHSLGLRVVAEGVESKETLDLLARLGCDTAQGYFLSRPLPTAALVRWLG